MNEPIEPRLTIRLGLDLHADVKDYLLIVRNSRNEVSTSTSSYSWALGAMDGATKSIQTKRYRRDLNE